MERLLAPAVALMNRLRFSAKAILVGGVVVAVTEFLVAHLFGALSAQREQMRNELVGLAYARPLYRMMLSVQQHRVTEGTAAAVDNVASEAEGLRGLAADLDKMAARFKV